MSCGGHYFMVGVAVEAFGGGVVSINLIHLAFFCRR